MTGYELSCLQHFAVASSNLPVLGQLSLSFGYKLINRRLRYSSHDKAIRYRGFHFLDRI